MSYLRHHAEPDEALFAMWSVKMSIPGDKFSDAMYAVSDWLTKEHLESSHFVYSRTASGEIKFRIGFAAAGDADRFATRFDGSVLPPEELRG